MSVRFKRAAILGAGLIGASLSRAMKARGLVESAVGWGRTEETLKRSVRFKYFDEYATEPKAACKGADLIVLATPVETFGEIMREIAGSIEDGALVIDVGSVKTKVIADVEPLVPRGASFVPCHPIAGSEKSGADASSEMLFDGALCVITPTENTGASALDRAEALWRGVGSQVERMDVDKHDRTFAMVSHFPHLAAFALVNTVGDIDPRAIKYAGAGLKDTTRIAMSSPALWTHICLMNRSNMLGAIEQFQKHLDAMRIAIESGDAATLEAEFARARALRGGVGY